MEFYCVYSKDALATKKYLSRVNSKAIKISYIDVYNKLTKNDVYLSEPNEMVVYSKVYTMLQKTLITDCNESTKVYYVISELDKDMIKGLRVMIKELYRQPFTFNLISRKDDFAKGYTTLFHEIKTFV
jgi:hypothetical protein